MPSEPQASGDQAHTGPDVAATPTFPGREAPRASSPDEPATGPEKDLWIGRTDWKHYIGRFVLMGLIWVVGGAGIVVMAQRSDAMTATHAAGAMFLLVVIVGGILAGPVTWTILSHRYRLTTQRLIIERGILSQTIDQTELVRVDDVRIHKSLADRVLGLGSVGVISTDATDREILIPGVAGPERLADAIRSRMRAARQRAVYVENV